MYPFALTMVILATIFGICAIIISAIHANRHIKHWRGAPHERPTLIILLLVPVWSFFSWLIVVFPKYDLYFKVFIDGYEAYVIYEFMLLMKAYLGGYAAAARILMGLPPMNILFCVRITPDEKLLKILTALVFQFVFVKPAVALLAIACEHEDVYTPGDFSPKGCFLYVTVIKLASMVVAMFGLFIFYRCCKNPLKPYHVVRKFVLIKLIIFLHILQNVFFQSLVNREFFVDSETESAEIKSRRAQYAFLGFEMFLLSIGMLFFFPHNERVDYGRGRGGEDEKELTMESLYDEPGEDGSKSNDESNDIDRVLNIQS